MDGRVSYLRSKLLKLYLAWVEAGRPEREVD